MFEQITVLVPTRGRVKRLRKMMESFRETSAGYAKLFFRVDDDDAETQKQLVGQSYIVGPRLNGYASLPWFFNQLAAASEGVLMLGNDDIVFKTPEWDLRILQEANKYPDGVFNFGVTTHNEQNFPLTIVSKKAVDVVGALFPDGIFWGDIFWRDVAAAFGRAIRLPSVEIDHEWAGFSPDQTFMAGDTVRRSDHMHHHQAAVDAAVEKLSANPAVRALREAKV